MPPSGDQEAIRSGQVIRQNAIIRAVRPDGANVIPSSGRGVEGNPVPEATMKDGCCKFLESQPLHVLPVCVHDVDLRASPRSETKAIFLPSGTSWEKHRSPGGSSTVSTRTVEAHDIDLRIAVFAQRQGRRCPSGDQEG